VNQLPPKSKRPSWKTPLIVAASLLAAGIGVPLAARTRVANRALDGWTISIMASVAERAPAGMPRPLPWTNEAALELLTRPPEQPLAVAAAPMTRFRMRDPALVQEVISFASAIQLDHPESNTARAYVYRHGRLGERPVVLWVPGQYAVDAVLAPVSGFTQQIVRRGADVVLFVPPYHLERTPAGFLSGNAVLATSTPDHLRVLAQELSDLRRLTGWLRAQGVPALGGFGTSWGGAVLLRTVTWDETFDFLTVFIPAISLGDLLDEPEAAPFSRRLAAEGHSPAEMATIYASLDPTRATPRLDVSRISVLYGRYDRIASERRILAWAQAWGVTRLHGYPRGHALALFTPSMYRDYARILNEDLRALGH
jgi:dienelactone hydrolase